MIDTIEAEDAAATREDAAPSKTTADDTASDERPEGGKPRKKLEEEAAASDAEPEAEAKEESASSVRRRMWSGLSWRWAAAGAVVVALCGTLMFGYSKYQQTQGELAQIHQKEADRNAAAQVAKDYALKSLTYTYQDPEAFFKSVEDGVAPTLKDKYVNVADLLKGIMQQARVESSGEILAADVTPQPSGVYHVVVSASQTTKNLQNPQPRISTMLLQVVVNKTGSTWQVSDIGPKTGSKPIPGDQTQLVKPDEAGPAAAAPAKSAAGSTIPGLH